MSIDIIPTLDEDLKAVNDAFQAGRPVPPDVNARLEERAAAFRKRMLQQQGALDIAVPYLRQARETGH